ncbi:HAMP domain-containing histidine kinase [Clostridium gasigenes]|uniref:sensor histidine kinase n=1 Tax=Clostridium gasigenes TaxID=94869 RepID=UPI001C0E88B8|nr:HAMP domain-containing sensor histidine kinase [Clostridium gasigenes]MBU3131363.1 HAMP domain-containing histidine kinase [Clostridium gasigenes]
MINIKKLLLIFCLSILITFSFNISSFANTNLYNNKYVSDAIPSNNILVMNSCNKTDFHSSLFEGLSLSIEDNLPNYKIFKNSTLGLSDDEIIANIKALIRDSKNNIKLVICLDANSTSFFEKYGVELFGSTPILFGYEGDNPIPIGPNMGGIFAPYNLEEFLDTILIQHKDTTQINFLISKAIRDTYFFDKIEEYINKKLSDPNNTLYYNVVDAGQSYDSIPPLTKEHSLNIVYSPIRLKYSENDLGRYSTPYGSLEKIFSKTSNPTYGGFKTFGTRFNIGACMYDGFSIGTKLGDYASSILKGSLSISTLGINPVDKGPILFINEELQSLYKFPNKFYKTVYYNAGNTESNYSKRKIRILSFVAIITLFLLIICIVINCFKRKALKERQKLDFIKTNFIANVSHELRTPLNIIISTIQLFDVYSENGEIIYNSDRAKEKTKYLKGNSFRLLRLVNNIIDITKIDSGYFTINKTSINIVEVIEEVTLSSVAYAEKKEINLIFDTNVEEIILPVDSDKIERIILNLLSNALKFTPPSGTITVTVLDNITCVTVIITDTGIGIAEDQFDIIFKRFRQVDGPTYNKSEGSGIGLALCKSMIEMHNGTIKVESKINEGTSFILTIPIEKSENPDHVPNVQNTNKHDIIQVEYSDFLNYM